MSFRSVSLPRLRLSTTIFEWSSLALVQWLAIITMLVDHLGALAILDASSRLIGRAALPAFVLMVAINAHRTLRPGRMVIRLLVLLVISQPLWWLSVGSWDSLCILVTLLAVVLLVWSLRTASPLGYVAFLATLCSFLICSPWIEYGVLPLLLVPFALRPSILTLALALVWPFLQYPPGPLQLAAFLALVLLLVLLRVPFDVPRSPRFLSRWFYPGHLAALSTIG